MKPIAALGMICLILAARAAMAEPPPFAKAPADSQQSNPGNGSSLLPPNPYHRPPDWLSGLDPDARRMWERVMSLVKLRIHETARWRWLLALRFENFDSGPTAGADEKILWVLANLGGQQAQRDIGRFNRALMLGSLEAGRKNGLTLRLSLGPPAQGHWYGGISLEIPFK
jgi:hypothetical protein